MLTSDLDLRLAETGPGSSASTSSRRLAAAGRGRQLAAASKTDPRLRDLFEVDFELGEVLDKPDDGEPSGIRLYINRDRQYAARWSPLKLELLSTFVEIEAMDAVQLETDSPNAIFDLPPSAYALVTLDLRHVPEQSRDWTYGEDWAISLTLSPNLTLGDVSEPTPMPEQFLSRS